MRGLHTYESKSKAADKSVRPTRQDASTTGTGPVDETNSLVKVL